MQLQDPRYCTEFQTAKIRVVEIILNNFDSHTNLWIFISAEQNTTAPKQTNVPCYTEEFALAFINVHLERLPKAYECYTDGSLQSRTRAECVFLVYKTSILRQDCSRVHEWVSTMHTESAGYSATKFQLNQGSGGHFRQCTEYSPFTRVFNTLDKDAWNIANDNIIKVYRAKKNDALIYAL